MTAPVGAALAAKAFDFPAVARNAIAAKAAPTAEVRA